MEKSRLVKAAPLEEFFENKAKSWAGTWSGPAYATALERVKAAPTVDAEEVVHGRWIDRISVKGQVYCSECATIEKATDYNFKSRRCPHCGAKMDGGNEDG